MVSVLISLMMSFAYALIKVCEQTILQCSICFPLGRNKQKNSKTEKSQKKNTTVGVITILQSILNKGVTYENTN